MKTYVFAIGAACVGLMSCAGPSTYSASDPVVQIDGFYDDGASDRDLKLVVFGDPFPGPQDQFARTVEADLRDAPVGKSPTRLLLSPGPSAKPIYRLVYVFSPSPDMIGNAICEHQLKPEANTDFPPAASGAPVPGGEVFATAAFCVEYRAVSEISGQTPADGPGDVRLYNLTRQMAAEVFRPDIHPHTGNPLGNAAAPRAAP